jgi:hypothetical protein
VLCRDSRVRYTRRTDSPSCMYVGSPPSRRPIQSSPVPTFLCPCSTFCYQNLPALLSVSISVMLRPMFITAVTWVLRPHTPSVQEQTTSLLAMRNSVLHSLVSIYLAFSSIAFHLEATVAYMTHLFPHFFFYVLRAELHCSTSSVQGV